MDVRRAVWGLAKGGAGVLIAAFLAGYVAPYLPPVHFWWTDLFAVLLPPLGVLVGGIGAGLLVYGGYRRTWGRAVSGSVLLLLVVARFGAVPTVPAWGASSPAEEALRVMTFNLPPALARGPDREDVLATLVRREAPAVLALQEAWVETGASPTGTPTRISWPLQTLLRGVGGYVLPPVRPPGTKILRPVMGRVSPDSMSVHPLPPSGDTTPRSRYTRTYFTWRGRAVVLYNVHLHTVGVRPQDLLWGRQSLAQWRAFLRTYREGALHRAEQARVLRRHIEQETRPVLVVGDLNSTPHQWAYRHLAQGLRAAGEGATFPAQRPVVRIDHILVGPEWEIEAAHVPALPGGELISDHRPAAARLRWRDDYDE